MKLIPLNNSELTKIDKEKVEINSKMKDMMGPFLFTEVLSIRKIQK